jgi:predicted hydrolase (HD superfamily)
MDTTESSVRKKWGNARFAAGVDRRIIEEGAVLLEMELPDLIDATLRGMREVAEAIGLAGSAQASADQTG